MIKANIISNIKQLSSCKYFTYHRVTTVGVIGFNGSSYFLARPKSAKKEDKKKTTTNCYAH